MSLPLVVKGAVAQLGERLLCKQEVASSILVSSRTSKELAAADPKGGRALNWNW